MAPSKPADDAVEFHCDCAEGNVAFHATVRQLCQPCDDSQRLGSDGSGNPENGGNRNRLNFGPFDDAKGGASRGRGRKKSCPQVLRANTVGLPRGDTGAEACNEKITKEAQDEIVVLRTQVGEFFLALKKCPSLIGKYDFTNTGDLVNMVENITGTMLSIAKNLCYSPLITEVTDICEKMSKIIEYIQPIPALIYVRLIDIGFCIHEFGCLLHEQLLPVEFALAIHQIQLHLRKLKTGGVVTQIIYVPKDYDPLVATYHKDARLRRIERLGNCKITLIRPDDPRAFYCPVTSRTIQVEFHEEKGRHIGLSYLLNRCIAPCGYCFPTRTASIIVKRFANETKRALKPREVASLKHRLPRPVLSTVKADLTSGTKIAAICSPTRVREFIE